jgi:hypothetical protein
MLPPQKPNWSERSDEHLAASSKSTRFNYFMQLGFNKAERFKSSSLLIYEHPEQIICRQKRWLDAEDNYKGKEASLVKGGMKR